MNRDEIYDSFARDVFSDLDEAKLARIVELIRLNVHTVPHVARRLSVPLTDRFARYVRARSDVSDRLPLIADFRFEVQLRIERTVSYLLGL